MRGLFILLGSISFCVFAGDFVVLDMKDYYNESSRVLFVKDLSRGFHEIGAVVVVNTGINNELVTRAFRAAEQFFSLSEKVKKKYDGAQISYQRGYLPLRAEKAMHSAEGDYKEVYHFGRDNNQYPKEIDIQDAIAPYFRELEHYMTLFQEAIAMAMGMPKGFFLPITTEGESILRAIHYPPHLGTWAEEHIDIDLFSIFPKATLGGLEIKDREEKWVKVEVPEGGVIVTAGYFLENLSNGYFPAGKQRVVSYEKRLDRYALGFFAHPKDHILLGPLSKMIEKTGGVKRYADLNRKELLIERLAHPGKKF